MAKERKLEKDTVLTGYMAQYQQAIEAKSARSLSAKYVEWKDKGQQLIGKLLAKNTVTGQLGGKAYYQYLFDTDEGLEKVALGTATDNEAGQLMQVGGVYSITYGGQEKIAGGRKINRFDVVEVVSPVDSGVGGSADIPF